MRHLLQGIVTILVVLLFSGCSLSDVKNKKEVLSPIDVKYSSTLSPEERLRVAQKNHLQGRNDESIRELTAIVNDYPSSSLLEEVYFELSDIYISQKRWEEAANSLQILLERFPLTKHRFDVEYRLAIAQFNLKDYGSTHILVQSLLSNPSLPLRMRERVTELKRGLLRKRKVEFRDNGGEGKGRGEVWKDDEGGDRVKDGVPVGVVLPLSGRYADFGEATLKGILLGAGIFGRPAEGSTPVKIVLRDSMGDPQKASEAVEELAEKEGVVSILGPLLSKNALFAARKAQGLEIPLITFSQIEGITDIGDYVFRNSLTPSMQAMAIAKYAVNELGIIRFGILYPNTSYGRSLASHFKVDIERLGGEIVRTEAYGDRETDFSEEIRRLFLIDEVEEDGEKDKKEFTPPVIDFDALYIPDYFERVALIAPQLSFYNVTGLQLLGSNGWNSQKLLEMGGRYVDGSIFVDGFSLYSKDKNVRGFINEFQENFEIQPGILEAQAYDTIRILMSLIKKNGLREREELKEGLKRVKHFSGVTGDTSFDESGDAEKELYLFKVKEGEIVSIEE